MIDKALQIAGTMDRPWVLLIGWPEPLRADGATVTAAVMSAVASKEVVNLVIVREDGRAVQAWHDKGKWFVRAGVFELPNQINSDAVLRHRDANAASMEPIKVGLIFTMFGRAAVPLSWQEITQVLLNFVGLATLPKNLVWRDAIFKNAGGKRS